MDAKEIALLLKKKRLETVTVQAEVTRKLADEAVNAEYDDEEDEASDE